MENNPNTAVNTNNQQAVSPIPSAQPDTAKPTAIVTNKGQHAGLIILIVGASIIVAAVFAILIIIPSNRHIFFGDRATQPQPSQPIPSDEATSLILPIRKDAPYVNFVGILYRFEGVLESVQESPLGTELVTTLEGPGVLRFIITSNTEFFKRSNGKRITASQEDLQIGQRIISTSVYNPEERGWNLSSVYITEDNLQASGSAVPQN